MTVSEYNQSVKDFADRLYRFALKNLNDSDLAKDFVQDAYEKLWMRIDQVDNNKVKSYIIGSDVKNFSKLIEGKAMAQSDIKITFEDLKTFTAKNIRQQMAQFGQTNPTDEEVQGIVARVLANQEEVKRLSDQVVAEKLLEIFKEKANPTTKEVTYEEFIAASYGE
jgi:hypothetical protein